MGVINMTDFGRSLKLWVMSDYKEKPLTQTINATRYWKGMKPDKRDVKVNCPKCNNTFCPLITGSTMEIETKRFGKERLENKRIHIIYGTTCPKCKEKFRFKVKMMYFYFPKLGMY